MVTDLLPKYCLEILDVLDNIQGRSTLNKKFKNFTKQLLTYNLMAKIFITLCLELL